MKDAIDQDTEREASEDLTPRSNALVSPKEAPRRGEIRRWHELEYELGLE